MKRHFKVLLIILLAVVVIIVIVTYIVMALKFVRTRTELKETWDRVIQGQEEREQLEGELGQTKEEMQRLKVLLDDTRKELDSVNAKLNAAEKRNIALVEEKQRLEAKLHSIEELRKAIQQVKLENRQKIIQQYLLMKEQQKELDRQKTISGNRGFIIKDGQSLYRPKIKIEVKPSK